MLMNLKQISTTFMMTLILSIPAAGITQAKATPSADNTEPVNVNLASPLAGPDPDTG